MDMEENNVKIFWKPVDGGELKELKGVAKSDDFKFEPLKESVDVQYDPTPVAKEYSFSFDMQLTPKQFKSIRKMFRSRLPRKFKKRYKNMVAKKFSIKPSKLRFRYNGVFNKE